MPCLHVRPVRGSACTPPADVHYGRAPAIREARGHVLDAAYQATPERFVRKPPEPPKLPGTVWINKPEDKEVPAQ